MSVAAEHGEPWPEHQDGWTVEALLVAPENKHQRIELVHGKLVVTPAPGFAHQRASRRLANLLERAAGAAGVAAEVLEAVNVVLPAGAGLVIPDIVVVPVEVSAAATVTADASRLLAVVEIVSASTRRMDRLVKPRIYAQAAIPVYWRLEPDGAVSHLVAYRLEAGRYVEVADAKGGEPTEIPIPFPVTLDPVELVKA